MFKRLIKGTFLATLPLIIMVFSILLNLSGHASKLSAAVESQSEIQINSENPLNSTDRSSELNTNSKRDADSSQTSRSLSNGFPDLGDDQVFPFVAGLDSYEGS